MERWGGGMILLALPKAQQPFEDINCTKNWSLYIGLPLMLARFGAKVQIDTTCLPKLFKIINHSNELLTLI